MKKHLSLLVIIITVLLNTGQVNAQVESASTLGKTAYLSLPSMGTAKSINADIDSTDVRNGKVK